MSEKKVLSASRMKTLESCSWKYWCTYHLHLPRSKNSGSVRGTVCHLVLELLLGKRHRKYIKKILKAGTIKVVPAIPRLVDKNLKKLGFLEEENSIMCDEMIVVALNCDFLGSKGAKIDKPEEQFLLESESPEYKIMGFIDKPIQYPKEDRVVIVDYKTSKVKFVQPEIEYNIQALAYILAAKQIWPKLKKTSVEFQFLRFPEQPTIEIKTTKEQLKGFEHYLEHLYKIINSYSEKDAHSNFASDQPFPQKGEGFKGPLNCGFAKYKGALKKNGDLMWHCEHKFAYDYYAVRDENNKIIKSAMTAEELEGLEGELVKLHYEGCPAHTQASNTEDDGFGF